MERITSTICRHRVSEGERERERGKMRRRKKKRGEGAKIKEGAFVYLYTINLVADGVWCCYSCYLLTKRLTALFVLLLFRVL